MEDSYFIIPDEPGGRISLRCLYVDRLYNGWNSDYELLFVLHGDAGILLEGSTCNLQSEDILLINEKTPFSLKSEGGVTLLSLKMDPSGMLPGGKANRFSCNSATDSNQEKYLPLKRILAELVKENATQSSNGNQYGNLSLMFSIFKELDKNFAAPHESAAPSEKYRQRISEILSFIEVHYREGLSLKTVADAIGLTVPYLSSFFEKYIGVTFLTYYNEVRLDKAMHDLLATDKTIEDVALSNGFTDPRSFVNVFKKKYGELPSAYRKSLTERDERIEYSVKRKMDSKYESHLTVLAKYLKQPAEERESLAAHAAESTPAKTLVRENVNVTNVIAPLRHTFKTFTSVGRAKELLYSDVQEMLTELQETVGFEYIKFHGLLSDDMLVYKENEYGEPSFSFVYVDKVIDFLLSIRLKPLIEFSFMPKDLAGPGTHEVYASPFYIGEPKSFDKWGELIDALMEHLIDRYSSRVVRTWLFSVWNEPDTTTSLFGLKKDEDFYRMYKIAYDIVKGHSAQIKVGTPSLIFSYKVYQPWIGKYIDWCNANNCRPDFVNIHYYDNDFVADNMALHSPAHPAHGRLNMDPDSFGKAIVDIKERFKEIGIDDLPIYLTEWNLTVSHRNLLNDTVFKSCYLAKNLLENYDSLNSFGYWALTDMMEETQPSANEFHGGLGLFSHSKIKKPHYFTFEFLNHLGNSLIEKGPGYFISKRHGCVQVFLYNYEHFNHLFASGESFDTTFLDRYTPFSMLGKMDVSLSLVGFTAKKCHIVTRIVNQKYGSPFDMWVSMNAPKMDEELIGYLQRICVPKIDFKDADIQDGKIEIKAMLDPLEIRLIEIHY